MSHSQVITAAFASGATSNLVVSSDQNPVIVGATNASCAWLGYTQKELLNTELFRTSVKLLEALGLSEPELSQLLTQVVTTKAAVTGANTKTTT